MSILSDPAASRLLDAALTLFSRHGFQRTSMADIALEAGLARATLYARFKDKRAVIEALATSLVETALAAAEAAWVEGNPLAANIEATLIAKDLPLYRLLHASPHGAALLAFDADLTRDHARRLDAGFAALLTRRAEGEAARGADLSAYGGAAGFGLFVAAAGPGLKHETRTEADYLAAVRTLATVLARATAPLAQPNKGTPP